MLEMSGKTQRKIEGGRGGNLKLEKVETKIYKHDTLPVQMQISSNVAH
jgi:hypothetical protein